MNNGKRKRRLLILCGCLLVMTGIWFLTERISLEEESSENDNADYDLLVHLTASDITEIGMNFQEESYNLKKEGEVWKALEDPSMKLDTDLIDTFLANVTALDSEIKIDDVTELEQYGLDSPYLNLTLQTENDMCVIKVGNYNSMISAYYVQINDESMVYTITSTEYYQLNKTLEDFEFEEEEDLKETAAD